MFDPKKCDHGDEYLGSREWTECENCAGSTRMTSAQKERLEVLKSWHRYGRRAGYGRDEWAAFTWLGRLEREAFGIDQQMSRVHELVSPIWKVLDP
jgi:hypothetical protein